MTAKKRRNGASAGGGKMRRFSRNARVRVNARMADTVKLIDPRPTSTRRTKEEWVIRRVTEIVGTKAGPGFVRADDVASDIILMLLDAGGFLWEDEEIEDFCRRKAAYMVLQYVSRRERSECEFTFENGEAMRIVDLASFVPAHQMTICEAREAEGFLRAIPKQQRQALEILCDGGNPIDVAEEMGVTPWAAIALIKEGRDYVGRVDPA